MMRFLCVFKAAEGTPHSQQTMEDMGKLIGEMTASGVLLATEGCLPSKLGARVRRSNGKITVTEDLKAVAVGADVLYTDVWVSMGKESESAARLKVLKGYQINQSLVKLAKPGALVMHCLPAYRGKEIDDATFEANADTIFTQAENRLHAQKAILNWAVS